MFFFFVKRLGMRGERGGPDEKWGGGGGGIKTKKINVSHRSYDKQRAQRPKNLTTVFKQVLQQVVKCL